MSHSLRYLTNIDKRALQVGKALQKYLQAGWPPWDGVPEYQLEMERKLHRQQHALVYGEMPRDEQTIHLPASNGRSKATLEDLEYA